MFIPGIVIQFLTFPGVIIHELSHAIFCRLCNLAILEICYFRNGNPAGYVIHEKPIKAYQNIWISIGPFIVNTILGAVIAMPAAIPVFTFSSGSPLDYVLIWLGVSIAMHAFPSTGDAQSLWSAIKESNNIFLKIITAPIVAVIYIGAVGSVVWLDLGFAIFVVMGLPNILVHVIK